MLRRIAERLSRGRIIKRKIYVRGKVLPIYVSPDAQLKYLKLGDGVFDQDLIQIAETYLKEDSCVWDIGANVGVFTFAAASVAKHGSVLAVEADTWLAGVLRKSALLSAYSKLNIRVLPVATSNKVGVASFMVSMRGRASNSLEIAGGRSEMGGVRELQYVPTMTLDGMLEDFGMPDFVKVDIEGAELMAIEGAEKLVNKIRPVFYVEVGADVSKQILSIFHAADYVAVDPDGSVLLRKCANNTFFIPKEKYPLTLNANG